jgi:rare lipoprotein A
MALAVLLVFGCSSRGPINEGGTGRDGLPPRILDLDAIPDAVPRYEPRSRYGNPESYVALGKRYFTLTSADGFTERGIASWYGTHFHGKRTSSGEAYDMYTMTAAHRTLPLPTYARVSNLQSGRSVVVRINDRGPFHDNRVIDLSYVAAAKLGIANPGTGLVEVRAISPEAPLFAASGPNPAPGEPAPRRPAPPPPPANKLVSDTPRASSPGIYLQVGAFGNRVNADRLRERLQPALNDAIRIQEAAHYDHPVFRVQIGPLADAEQTDALTERLSALGIADARVVVE